MSEEENSVQSAVQQRKKIIQMRCARSECGKSCLLEKRLKKKKIQIICLKRGRNTF